MPFSISEFKTIVEKIERKHPAFFNTADTRRGLSVHDFYYIYFGASGHHLRFITNSSLPAQIKEEISAAYEDYRLSVESQ